MRERYLVGFCQGNALCYHMDGLDSNPIFITSYLAIRRTVSTASKFSISVFAFPLTIGSLLHFHHLALGSDPYIPLFSHNPIPKVSTT